MALSVCPDPQARTHQLDSVQLTTHCVTRLPSLLFFVTQRLQFAIPNQATVYYGVHRHSIMSVLHCLDVTLEALCSCRTRDPLCLLERKENERKGQ